MAELFQASLYDVFRTSVFLIPDYQRGYSWGERQWNDLLEDLELLPPERTHFFGTLVLRDTGKRLEDEKDNEFKVFEIIDGQQRLTTSVIFLSVIYQEMKKRSKHFNKQPDGLRENFLSYTDHNTSPCPKLILNEDCRDYFQTNILGFDSGIIPQNPEIRSHRLIQGAKQHLESYLAALEKVGEAAYIKQLETLYDKIKKGLQLVVYEVDAEMDAAGLIFERMNDRGKGLTELELVKNYILYLSSILVLETDHRLRDVINDTWTDVFKYLMQIDDQSEIHESLLLRYHWVMTKTGNTRPVDNRSIKDEFNLKKYPVERHPELHQELLAYLNSLGRAARAYRDIRRPNHSDAFLEAKPDLRGQVKKLSERFVRLGASATFIPLLIAVRLKSNDQGETYLKVVELCEKYSFRVYAWDDRQPRTGQSSIYSLTRDYYNGKMNEPQLIKRLIELTLAYCSDQRFEERFDRESVNWYAWPEIKYFLYEYEEERASQRGLSVRMRWEDLVKSVKEDTIEHILPRNPKKGYWTDRFDSEAHERWKNDIGNLTLTYINGSLSNLPFPEKKNGRPGREDCYARSLLVIEQELVEFQDWTVESIQHRRGQIRDWAKKRWQLPPPRQVVSAAPSATPTSDKSTSRRAIWASNIDRNPEEWLISLAEENGFKDEFCLLLSSVRQAGLYARMQNNWWGVSATPYQNKNFGVIWFGPDLYFHPTPERIEESFQIPAENVIQALGKERRILKPQEVPDLAAAIVRLFKEKK